jgi:hypothetical protein
VQRIMLGYRNPSLTLIGLLWQFMGKMNRITLYWETYSSKQVL